MKITTLEKYIKHTTEPYGDLLKRAGKTLDINYCGNGVVKVKELKKESNMPWKREMILYFENENIYKKNKTCGLIATHYNYN